MKKVIICTILIVAVMACQKKALPVITERKSEPVKRSILPYPPKETVAPDTVAGKMIFTNRCGRCHVLPDPLQYRSQRWENILASMIPKARLDNEQALHVRAYVLANAGK